LEEPTTHENDVLIGKIVISVMLTGDSAQYATAYKLYDIDLASAIGHVQLVHDRLRKDGATDWVAQNDDTEDEDD
jgi:hypothetical protein